MSSTIISLFFAVLALSSCTDKMDYFPDLNSDAKTVVQPAPKKANRKKSLVPRVRVMPVEGVSVPMGHLLARSVAKSLVELHISAVAGGNPDGGNDYLLSGRAEANWKDQRTPFTAIIRWTLVDKLGKPAAAFVHGVRASWWQWQNGAPQVIRMVGISAAKPVADLLAVKTELPAPPELMDTALIVGSVRGAPGNGNQALKQGVIKALGETDVSVTEDPRQAAFTLNGVVILSANGNEMKKAVVEWTVKAINGRKVGKSSRRIMIPGGKTGADWDRIARQSSRGVVADIEEIITGTNLSSRSGPLPGPSSGEAARPPSFRRPTLRHVPGRALPPPQ